MYWIYFLLLFTQVDFFGTTFYFLESRKFSHYICFLKSRIFGMYFYFLESSKVIYFWQHCKIERSSAELMWFKYVQLGRRRHLFLSGSKFTFSRLQRVSVTFQHMSQLAAELGLWWFKPMARYSRAILCRLFFLSWRPLTSNLGNRYLDTRFCAPVGLRGNVRCLFI